MKKNVLTVIVGAVLVIIIALLLFVFQVRQSEVAVITTFGKPSPHTYDKPGAYFKWPWPIQKVYKFDSRVQNFEDRLSENLTADQINLVTSVYVGWKISDGQRFLMTIRNGSVSDAEQKLETILRAAKNAVIGKHQLSEFVNSDPKQLKFEAIEKEIQQNVQTQLSTNNIGMEVTFLGFKKIGLPESVTQTVFDRMKSERQQLIAKNQSQGEGDAMKIKSAAERQAAQMLSTANAEAIQIRAAGERAAATTYPIFQQNPELANFLLRLDALQKSLNQKSTLIFDERTPPFDLFSHLPTNSPAH